MMNGLSLPPSSGPVKTGLCSRDLTNSRGNQQKTWHQLGRRETPEAGGVAIDTSHRRSVTCEISVVISNCWDKYLTKALREKGVYLPCSFWYSPALRGLVL